MPSSSAHRHHKKLRPSAPATRDWTTLPRDVLLTVFLKLEPREILRGADHVCEAWRHVTLREPVLWRHIDMGRADLSQCCAAMRRGAGQCESFAACWDSNASLRFLVKGAPSLKSLHLCDANTSFAALQVPPEA
ncbi:hypothetical protein HU200_056132 [Digitaria exilis]|uniref:F-box domain-containing protein n=1 Tax=Digitaria exilis TaxID=1010633 RepID=A0A835E2Q4_9POAL|nr:hypothetical protein HU200_056132 [Digitaria exilis]